VKCEWINCPETLSPPMIYFDRAKYFSWSFNTELAEVKLICFAFIHIYIAYNYYKILRVRTFVFLADLIKP